MISRTTVREFLNSPERFRSSTFIILNDFRPQIYADKIWYNRVEGIPRAIFDAMEGSSYKCETVVTFNKLLDAQNAMSNSLIRFSRQHKKR